VLPIDNYSSRAAELFLSLPIEIQIQVADYLNIDDLFSLRICSRAVLAFLQSNAAMITRIMLPRTYLGDEPMFVQCLYPQPVPMTNMNYLLQILHREAVVKQMIESMVNPVQEISYPVRSSLQVKEFRQLAHRLRKPALMLYHFLESLQRLHLAICKDKVEYTSCASSTYLIKLSAIIDEYPEGDVVSAFHFYKLLLLHLKRSLCASTETLNGTRLGWAPEPAKDEEIAQLLVLGGMGPVREVVDSSTYTTRLARLRDFIDRLSGEEKSAGSGAASGGPEVKESEFTAIQEVVIPPDKINTASLGPLPSLNELGITAFQDRIVKEELVDYEREFKSLYLYF